MCKQIKTFRLHARHTSHAIPFVFIPVQAAVSVDDCHVHRAWVLLQVLLKMKESWSKPEDDGVLRCQVPKVPTEFLTKVPQFASLPSELTSFPATQPDKEKPPVADTSSMPVPKALQVGFGPDGTSAQSEPSFMTDREIFRKTLLRGKPKVSFSDLSLRRTEKPAEGGKTKKASVTKEAWEAVMEAGFSQFPVGKLENKGTGKSVVTFAQVPDDEPGRLQFHDWLVQAAETSVRQWVDAMTREQLRKKRSREPAEADKPAEKLET